MASQDTCDVCLKNCFMLTRKNKTSLPLRRPSTADCYIPNTKAKWYKLRFHVITYSWQTTLEIGALSICWFHCDWCTITWSLGDDASLGSYLAGVLSSVPSIGCPHGEIHTQHTLSSPGPATVYVNERKRMRIYSMSLSMTRSGPCFNTKSFLRYRDSHYINTTLVIPPCLYNRRYIMHL